MSTPLKRRIIVITNLYPNCLEANRGIFIRQLVEQLSEAFELEVVAPIPWRPKWWELKRLGNMRIPEQTHLNGISVHHPRYLVIPKIMRRFYGRFFYWGIRKLLASLHKENPYDLISAHWVYPDGYGALLCANDLGIPIAVHGLGCDINEFSRYPGRRERISKTLSHARLTIVKSERLKQKAISLGAPKKSTHVVLNGVNQSLFFPRSQKEARQKLGLRTELKYLLFAGNFQIEKGLVYLLDAMEKIENPDIRLLLIGGGPDEHGVRERLSSGRLHDSVELIGRVEHHQLPLYLSAVDALCLPSLREGCPNIVLEALSCGTPVLASDVGAVPDIITRDELGTLVPPKSSEAIAKAIPHIVHSKQDKAFEFSWFDWKQNAATIAEHYTLAFQGCPAPVEKTDRSDIASSTSAIDKRVIGKDAK